MSLSKLAFVSVFILFLALAFSSVTPGLAQSSGENAANSLSKAEGSMDSAYQTVLDLKSLGGNVNDSIAQLNEAAGFLAKAQVAYRLGEFDDAFRLANLCYDISNRVKVGTENSLLQAAAEQSSKAFITITGSIVGLVVSGLCSFWLWRVFQRRYNARILRMKPEVASNES
jgi:hypothetical protein